ncbi:MAG: hypothetical protein ACK5M4_09450 [Pseudorhodobacter sp.]
MKIMLFGDSHLAALKRGMAKVVVSPDVEISFWGTPGNRFRNISWRDGQIVPDDDATARAFARFNAQGLTRLDPAQYDMVVFVGARIRPGAVIPDILNHMMHRRRHLSQAFIRALLADHLRGHSTYQMARNIAADGTRVVLNPISFETEGKGRPPRNLSRARRAGEAENRLLQDHITAVLAEDGIEAILQPLESITNGYQTRARFGVDGGDAVHKNADYGAVILQRILAQAGVTDASFPMITDL